MKVGDSFFVPRGAYDAPNLAVANSRIYSACNHRIQKFDEDYVVRARTAEQEAADGQPPREGWRVWRTK